MTDEEAVIAESGFQVCEFGPDDDECERCSKPNLQLYYRRDDPYSQDGTYYCRDCVLAEHNEAVEEGEEFSRSQKKGDWRMENARRFDEVVLKQVSVPTTAPKAVMPVTDDYLKAAMAAASELLVAVMGRTEFDRMFQRQSELEEQYASVEAWKPKGAGPETVPTAHTIIVSRKVWRPIPIGAPRDLDPDGKNRSRERKRRLRRAR